MRTVTISLPDANSVQQFVDIVSSLPGSFDLVSGSYLLDACSLIGVIQLDRSQPLSLNVQLDTPQTMEALSPFLINTPTGGNL